MYTPSHLNDTIRTAKCHLLTVVFKKCGTVNMADTSRHCIVYVLSYKQTCELYHNHTYMHKQQYIAQNNPLTKTIDTNLNSKGSQVPLKDQPAQVSRVSQSRMCLHGYLYSLYSRAVNLIDLSSNIPSNCCFVHLPLISYPIPYSKCFKRAKALAQKSSLCTMCLFVMFCSTCI